MKISRWLKLVVLFPLAAWTGCAELMVAKYPGSEEAQTYFDGTVSCVEKNTDTVLRGKCGDKINGKVITARVKELSLFSGHTFLYADDGDTGETFVCILGREEKKPSKVKPETLSKGDLVQFKGVLDRYRYAYHVTYLEMAECELLSSKTSTALLQ
jgi:hypothetical protein